MNNGNGTRRILVRRVIAVAGMLGLAALMFSPPPAAADAPENRCIEKCQAEYVEDALKCGKIRDEEDAYKACHNKAFVRNKSCREGCARKENDCLEHCKELCYQIMDKCKEDCKSDPNVRECRSRCTNAYGECLKECDKKCKGK